MVVQPTVRNRIAALDVLRGFAILGILLANIPSFATEDFGFSSAATAPASHVDHWIELLTLVFVNGKFRSLLAILFGVGVWLQYRKRSEVEGNWPGGYIKRNLWLGAIGLFHGLFIWYGDILFFYAGMAILTCLLVGVDGRILKAIIGGFVLLGLLCGGGLAAVVMLVGDGSSSSGMDWLMSSNKIAEVYQSGSYVEQLQIRAVMFLLTLSFMTGLGISMLPLFLLGVLFGRSGVLQAPSEHRATTKACLLVGLGIGLPLNLLPLAFPRNLEGFRLTAEFVSGPLLALGYMFLVAIIVEKGRFAWMTKALSQVGRIALTTYLGQSLICTFVFYSWGLGLFSRLDNAGQLVVVLVVWAINVAFAYLWLRRYSMGPIEWFWRSLTEGRRLPLRISDTPVQVQETPHAGI